MVYVHGIRTEKYKYHKYMLFAGWEVRMVKNCDRGLENTARGRRPRAAFSRPRESFHQALLSFIPSLDLFTLK